MKRRAYPAAVMPAEQISNHFLRGFLTTGLLGAVAQPGAKDKKVILRRALQGGTALAAGVAAANALQRGEFGRALLAAALGASGLAAIGYTLNDSHQNTKGSEA